MGGFSLKALLLFNSGRGCTWLRKRNRVVRCHVTSCRWARLWTEWVRSLPRLSLCCAGSALLNSLGWNFYSFLKSAVFSILSCSFPLCLFSTFFLVSSSVWEEWNLHNEGKVKTKAFQREPACSFDRLQGPQTRCQNLQGFQLARAQAWRWGSSPGALGPRDRGRGRPARAHAHTAASPGCFSAARQAASFSVLIRALNLVVATCAFLASLFVRVYIFLQGVRMLQFQK